MRMIDFLIGGVFRLLVLVAAAVLIVQNFALITSVLLAALLGLVILRLGWPSPRR